MYGKAKGKGKKAKKMPKHEMPMKKKGKKGSRQAFIDKAEDALGDQPL
jgi:hypothetical protein